MYVISMCNISNPNAWESLYDPDRITEKRVVYDIQPVQKTLGSAGSFGFTVPKANPLYDDICKFGTEIQLFRKPGKLLFRGRVASVTRDLNLNKIVRCEGALAYLNDILVRPFVYRNGSGDSFGMSAAAHYGELSRVYNSRCSEGRTLSFTTNIDEHDVLNDPDYCTFYGISEFRTIMEAVEDILNLDSRLSIDIYYAGSSCTLSLARIPFHTLALEPDGIGMDITRNIINYTEDDDESNICTAIIPLGEDNRVIYANPLEPYSGESFKSGLVSKYGIIEKTVNFDSANTDTKLRRFAERTIIEIQNEDSPTINLSAVDMFHLGVNSDMIDVGYLVPVSSAPHGVNESLICTGTSFTIESIDDSSYTFKKYTI